MSGCRPVHGAAAPCRCRGPGTVWSAANSAAGAAGTSGNSSSSNWSTTVYVGSWSTGGPQLESQDTATGHVNDYQFMILQLDKVAFGGNAAQPIHHKSGCFLVGSFGQP